MRLLSPKAVASLYGCGYVKPAPGTLASLVALAAAAAIVAAGGQLLLAVATAVAVALGYFSIGRILQNPDLDPPWVVIDELAGMWLALLAVGEEPLLWAAAFLLFRLLDIAKPFPINLAEKRLKGAAAVMADDLLAGGITALVILAALRV